MERIKDNAPPETEFRSRGSPKVALEGIWLRGARTTKTAALGRSRRDVSVDASVGVCLQLLLYCCSTMPVEVL